MSLIITCEYCGKELYGGNVRIEDYYDGCKNVYLEANAPTIFKCDYCDVEWSLRESRGENFKEKDV
ncbi:MAG: hypothetical protein GY679_01770 [Mycoplasma sp.]|nr:hypothetical protein [Mycoplasma sp.]